MNLAKHIGTGINKKIIILFYFFIEQIYERESNEIVIPNVNILYHVKQKQITKIMKENRLTKYGCHLYERNKSTATFLKGDKQ